MVQMLEEEIRFGANEREIDKMDLKQIPVKFLKNYQRTYFTEEIKPKQCITLLTQLVA